MIKSINGWTFPADMPVAEAARIARAAGFAGFEPTLNATGELTPQTDEPTCRQLGETIRAEGLQVVSLASGLFWQTHYTHSDAGVRQAAMELTIACLDRAQWLGAEVLLVVPGVVRRDKEPRTLVCGYADALVLAFQALQQLMPEAEKRGIVIALENVWNGFLLSPVELAEFIDRINSPWIGVYFDVGNVLKFGMPEDWIRTLGPRISRVHLKDYRAQADATAAGFAPLGEGDADWPSIMAALREVRYQGPMTFEGPGDPVEISGRVDKNLGTL